MDIKIVEQFVDELLPSFEALDTQSAAMVRLFRDKGLATEEEISTYLEQASNASNVRWRATRLRIVSLLGSAIKNAEESAANKNQPTGDKEPGERTHSDRTDTGNPQPDTEEAEAQGSIPAKASTRDATLPGNDRNAASPSGSRGESAA